MCSLLYYNHVSVRLVPRTTATLKRRQKVYVREREGRTAYLLVIPLEFGDQHDLKNNREVLVEYGETLIVTPLKEAEDAAA